jgi:ribosomal protein S18 acetylase RimI-like enzyme
MVSVREVVADDWELLRDVRLAALREAPHAFGSTYAREAPFTEEQWRGRISQRAVTFFAFVTESNEPARRLYEHCGFTTTGERQPLPSRPALTEIRMRRRL